jgi:uncharacterized protein (TIGR02391 family)
MLYKLLNIFFSGDLIVPDGEINRLYLQLSVNINILLQKKGFEHLNSMRWLPFKNLISLDPDSPDIEWEYGGQQLCGDFLSEIEKMFIERGEKKNKIDSKNIAYINDSNAYLNYYRNIKKEHEEIFWEKVKKEGKKWMNEDGVSSSDVKIKQDSYNLLYNNLITQKDIKKASETLYKTGQYRNSVLDAYIKIEEMVKNKLGKNRKELKEQTSTKLMRSVFNIADPILVWSDLTEPSEKDEYEGYSHIFAGAMMGIRNPKAHTIFEQEPMRALRLLCLANLLAEIIEVSHYKKKKRSLKL